jgi:hypothetical protein
MMMLPGPRKKRQRNPTGRPPSRGRALRLDAGAGVAASGRRFQRGDVYRTKSGVPAAGLSEAERVAAELVARVESIVETILSVPTLRTRHDVDWSGSTLVGTSRAHLTLAKTLGAHFAAA